MPIMARHRGGGDVMARHTPTIQAGVLFLEPPTGGDRVEVVLESAAWFRWLESARTFAFEDASGRFTARKRRRWDADYWYAFRRGSGRLYETYLGKARDITLGRLHAAAVKLSQLATRTSAIGTEVSTGIRSRLVVNSRGDLPQPSIVTPNAPRVRVSQLIHTAAVDRLAAAAEHVLTVVSAPAGYGKTSLLAQAIETLPLSTTWLTLDQSDNDPISLLTRVAIALDRVVPGLLEAMHQAAGRGWYRSADVLLAALIAALPNVPAPSLLVLDDYHELQPDNAAVHAAVAHLVAHLPPQMHLIVASRVVPPLPLAALRTRYRLLELGTTDLQLTLPETRDFLARYVPQRLTDEEVEVLHARTEGWIAALQFAALSLRGQADLHAWIAQFSGANRHIFNYLVEEVVKHLPPHLYKFALQISLLDRLCGPLCDAVTRSGKSQAMLEEMECSNLFLVPLDDRREWYRLHHLFADVLRRHLRQTWPDLVPHVYVRASVWCESHELALEAIDYALAANEAEAERTAQLIEAYIPSAIANRYFVLLRERLESLPDKLVRDRPRLAVAHALTLILAGERVMFPRRVQEAEQAVARATHQLDPSEVAILKAETVALRVSISALMGEAALPELIATLERAQASLPHDHEFRSYIVLITGICQILDGNVRAGSKTLDSLMRTSGAQGDRFYVGNTVMHLGHALLHQGHFDAALALCTHVERRLAVPGDDALEGLVRIIRGQVHYARGELGQALDYLRQADSLSDYDPCAFWIEGFSALAHVHLALGNRDAAQWTMERDVATWEESQAERKILWVWTGRYARAHQARLWLLQGDVESAATWAREVARASDGAPKGRAAPPSHVHEWEAIVLARLHLATHREGDALARLTTLSAAAETDGRLTRLLEILVLKAVAHDALDDTPAAMATLWRALELGRPQRFVSTFVEGGPVIRRLLSLPQSERARQSASDECGTSGLPAKEAATLHHYIADLLEAFTAAEQTGSIQPGRQPEAMSDDESSPRPPALTLTPRERKVLRLIAAGASNNDIARILVIAVPTAKRHVSNIFAALEVHRRTQAVARARELGLLSADESDEIPPGDIE